MGKAPESRQPLPSHDPTPSLLIPPTRAHESRAQRPSLRPHTRRAPCAIRTNLPQTANALTLPRRARRAAGGQIGRRGGPQQRAARGPTRRALATPRGRWRRRGRKSPNITDKARSDARQGRQGPCAARRSWTAGWEPAKAGASTRKRCGDRERENDASRWPRQPKRTPSEVACAPEGVDIRCWVPGRRATASKVLQTLLQFARARCPPYKAATELHRTSCRGLMLRRWRTQVSMGSRLVGPCPWGCV